MVLAALLLVIAFGNPAYTDWANNHTSNDAWGFLLKQLAWPTWSFSSDESVRTILANDVKAILLIVLTGVFIVTWCLAPRHGHLTRALRQRVTPAADAPAVTAGTS